jgi:hypothetical protein
VKITLEKSGENIYVSISVSGFWPKINLLLEILCGKVIFIVKNPQLQRRIRHIREYTAVNKEVSWGDTVYENIS